MLKKLRKKLKYEQKSHWDKLAYSYLKSCNPILDVGCGEGRFIYQDPKAILGVDWNPETVENCRRKGYNVIEGDIRALPVEDGSISGIHCSHVIEHFLPSDVYKILTELNRVLRNQGILVIRSPLLWDEFYSDLTHVRPYNPKAIIHYLTAWKQCTSKHISKDYEVIYLKWRYKPLKVRIKYIRTILRTLNRWGFPWIQKNGYMLVMRKKKSC